MNKEQPVDGTDAEPMNDTDARFLRSLADGLVLAGQLEGEEYAPLAKGTADRLRAIADALEGRDADDHEDGPVVERSLVELRVKFGPVYDRTGKEVAMAIQYAQAPEGSQDDKVEIIGGTTFSSAIDSAAALMETIFEAARYSRKQPKLHRMLETMVAEGATCPCPYHLPRAMVAGMIQQLVLADAANPEQKEGSEPSPKLVCIEHGFVIADGLPCPLCPALLPPAGDGWLGELVGREVTVEPGVTKLDDILKQGLDVETHKIGTARALDDACSACGAQLFETSSGLVCVNGHGGPEVIS